MSATESKVYLEDSVNNSKCVGGTNHIRRSANTNMSKNYHRNYHSYLKSKCKTYEDNARLGSQNDDGTYKSAKCSTIKKSDGTTCDKQSYTNLRIKCFRFKVLFHLHQIL